MVLSSLALGALMAAAAMAGSLKVVDPRGRKFETLFDGDEIDGKVYPLEAGVTGLDQATGDYLVQAGRLAEVEDERFAQLKGAGQPNSQADGGDANEADAEADADAERLEAAHAAFNAGDVPSDLINPDAAADATDKLVSKDNLLELANAANATFKASSTKAELAAAIMAARAKAEASAAS